MTDLKTQHLLTLAHILSKGGKHNFVNITTTSLGKEIGKSQQSASLHLKEFNLDENNQSKLQIKDLSSYLHSIIFYQN